MHVINTHSNLLKWANSRTSSVKTICYFTWSDVVRVLTFIIQGGVNPERSPWLSLLKRVLGITHRAMRSGSGEGRKPSNSRVCLPYTQITFWVTSSGAWGELESIFLGTSVTS